MGPFEKALQKAAKTGEGSRGGKVIGHTKSGKPIYAPQYGEMKDVYWHRSKAKAHEKESADMRSMHKTLVDSNATIGDPHVAKLAEKFKRKAEHHSHMAAHHSLHAKAQLHDVEAHEEYHRQFKNPAPGQTLVERSDTYAGKQHAKALADANAYFVRAHEDE